jgi:thiamine monophosphate synthase
LIRLLAITDPRYALDVMLDAVELMARALGPAFALQLRGFADVDEDFAVRLREATGAHGSALFVNRERELALRVGADGLHGAPHQLTTEFCLRSTPIHGDRELPAALSRGATHLLVSPIFDTPGKGPARGVEALAAALRTGAAVLALGGVDEGSAALAFAAGANGVAAIRAAWERPAALAAACKLHAL